MIRLLRYPLAFVSGFLLFCSYEPLGWWWTAIPSIALLYFVLSPIRGQRIGIGVGALLGFIHALGNYLFLLPWIGEFVGKMPYLALSVTEALYSAAFGVLAVIILRSSRWAPLMFAFWYVAIEFIRSSWPFNGFAWVRLAWGQVDGPIAHVSALGGPALVTWTVALLGGAVAALFLSETKPDRIRAAVPAALSIVLIAAGLLLPAGKPTGEVTVAAIQGNVPRMGLDFNTQRRAVLANHARVTQELKEPVDLVVWPENSSDVNPFTDAQAESLIKTSVLAVQAPILVGTITADDVGERNTMQVFNADGTPGEHHYKKYLQPFGEYMPFRELLRKVSPLVDLAGDFKPGDGSGTVNMITPRNNQTVTLGVATCYEVAFDAAYRDAVNHGAELLATPTNNATFGFTDMTYQQLAMSRMRAIELDRAVVVAATSGASAIVLPDGSVTHQSKIFTPAALVDTLPLKDSITPAARVGKFVEWFLVAMGVIAAVACVPMERREARAQKSRKRANARRARKTR